MRRIRDILPRLLTLFWTRDFCRKKSKITYTVWSEFAKYCIIKTAHFREVTENEIWICKGFKHKSKRGQTA